MQDWLNTMSPRERIECPEIAEDRGAGEASRSCWVFRDGAAFRVLAAPGPCL